MEQMTGLNIKLIEMAKRIRELRQIAGYTTEQMASLTDVAREEY